MNSTKTLLSAALLSLFASVPVAHALSAQVRVNVTERTATYECDPKKVTYTNKGNYEFDLAKEHENFIYTGSMLTRLGGVDKEETETKNFSVSTAMNLTARNSNAVKSQIGDKIIDPFYDMTSDKKIYDYKNDAVNGLTTAQYTSVVPVTVVKTGSNAFCNRVVAAAPPPPVVRGRSTPAARSSGGGGGGGANFNATVTFIIGSNGRLTGQKRINVISGGGNLSNAQIASALGLPASSSVVRGAATSNVAIIPTIYTANAGGIVSQRGTIAGVSTSAAPSQGWGVGPSTTTAQSAARSTVSSVINRRAPAPAPRVVGSGSTCISVFGTTTCY